MHLSVSYSARGTAAKVRITACFLYWLEYINILSFDVGYDSDFAVSRYKRGLECAEFVRLTKYFDLQDFIKIRLYTHPAEEAVVILGDIMDADVSSASQYVLQYLRISGGIVNADLRAQSLQYLVDHDALRMHGN